MLEVWNDSFGRNLISILVFHGLVLPAVAFSVGGGFTSLGRWWRERQGMLESMVFDVFFEQAAGGRWIDESAIITCVQSLDVPPRPPFLLSFEISLALSRLVWRGDLEESKRYWASPEEGCGRERVYAFPE